MYYEYHSGHSDISTAVLLYLGSICLLTLVLEWRPGAAGAGVVVGCVLCVVWAVECGENQQQRCLIQQYVKTPRHLDCWPVSG